MVYSKATALLLKEKMSQMYIPPCPPPSPGHVPIDSSRCRISPFTLFFLSFTTTPVNYSVPVSSSCHVNDAFDTVYYVRFSIDHSCFWHGGGGGGFSHLNSMI